MKPTRTILAPLAVLLALPFWAVLLGAPLRLLHALGVNAPLLDGLLAIPLLLATLALADLPRYSVLSVAALVAALTALGVEFTRQRAGAWRRPALYLYLAAVAGVLALPLAVGAYRPAVSVAAGVELQPVEQPDGLAGIVKRLQVGAEVRPLVYEPLGWADEHTLVYRTRRGAGYDLTGAWQEGSPGTVGAARLWAGGSGACGAARMRIMGRRTTTRMAAIAAGARSAGSRPNGSPGSITNKACPAARG